MDKPNNKRTLQVLWERAIERAQEHNLREQDLEAIQLNDAAGITGGLKIRSDLRVGVGSIWGTCGVNCNGGQGG
ncbi:MAG TPA: hypothetical protein VFD70_25220 [Anaerolineae bacterium]|nr:hypothetical protein [Anaerolineae bacterium]